MKSSVQQPKCLSLNNISTTNNKINIKQVIENFIIFGSIICAFQFISLTFNRKNIIEKIIGIKFSNKKIDEKILLIYALYLIFIKTLYFIAYKYDSRIPKKVIFEGDDENQTVEKQQQTALQGQRQTEEKVPSANSLSELLSSLMSHSIYYLVLVSCITAFTYRNSFNRENNYELVSLQKLNFLIFWYLIAIVFYSLGKIAGRIFNLCILHIFGFGLAMFVLIMEIGLAHGFNMFIFI